MELGLLPTTLIGMVMKSVLFVSTLSFELTDLRPLLQCVWVMIIARKDWRSRSTFGSEACRVAQPKAAMEYSTCGRGNTVGLASILDWRHYSSYATEVEKQNVLDLCSIFPEWCSSTRHMPNQLNNLFCVYLMNRNSLSGITRNPPSWNFQQELPRILNISQNCHFSGFDTSAQHYLKRLFPLAFE